jgi:hypothetical protein
MSPQVDVPGWLWSLREAVDAGGCVLDAASYAGIKRLYLQASAGGEAVEALRRPVPSSWPRSTRRAGWPALRPRCWPITGKP